MWESNLSYPVIHKMAEILAILASQAFPREKKKKQKQNQIFF